jgi:hypothetical protein
MKYMPLTPNARALAAAALIALTSAACTDNGTSTGPTPPSRPEAAFAMAAKPRGRVPYISDLTLGSIYVSVTSGSTPFTVTVTNQTKKDFQDIYVMGALSQNNVVWPATAFLAYCPGPNGIIPPGSCTMSNGITGITSTLTPGPATYTLRVVQQQADGTMLVLDSKTVDVTLYDSEIVR